MENLRKLLKLKFGFELRQKGHFIFFYLKKEKKKGNSRVFFLFFVSRQPRSLSPCFHLCHTISLTLNLYLWVAQAHADEDPQSLTCRGHHQSRMRRSTHEVHHRSGSPTHCRLLRSSVIQATHHSIFSRVALSRFFHHCSVLAIKNWNSNFRFFFCVTWSSV